MIFVIGANNTTYEIKEIKHVLIHRKEKKYAFITVLSRFSKGKVLAFQSI